MVKQPLDRKTPTRNARIGRPDTTHDCCRGGRVAGVGEVIMVLNDVNPES